MNIRLPSSFSRFLAAYLSLAVCLSAVSSRAAPAALVSTCAIQGSGAATPYAGQTVTVRGIVFADLDTASKKGFFIQHENCDADPSTSDGIFVYLGSQTDVVSVGDGVEVTGTAQEYYEMTEIVAAPGDVSLLSNGNPLPAASEQIGRASWRERV